MPRTGFTYGRVCLVGLILALDCFSPAVPRIGRIARKLIPPTSFGVLFMGPVRPKPCTWAGTPARTTTTRQARPLIQHLKSPHPKGPPATWFHPGSVLQSFVG